MSTHRFKTTKICRKTHNPYVLCAVTHSLTLRSLKTIIPVKVDLSNLTPILRIPQFPHFRPKKNPFPSLFDIHIRAGFPISQPPGAKKGGYSFAVVTQAQRVVHPPPPSSRRLVSLPDPLQVPGTPCRAVPTSRLRSSTGSRGHPNYPSLGTYLLALRS